MVEKFLGERIQAEREQAGVTPLQAARHLGLPYFIYIALENGNAVLRERHINKLADLFRIPRWKLIGGIERSQFKVEEAYYDSLVKLYYDSLDPLPERSPQTS